MQRAAALIIFKWIQFSGTILVPGSVLNKTKMVMSLREKLLSAHEGGSTLVKSLAKCCRSCLYLCIRGLVFGHPGLTTPIPFCHADLGIGAYITGGLKCDGCGRLHTVVTAITGACPSDLHEGVCVCVCPFVRTCVHVRSYDFACIVFHILAWY